MLSKALEVNTTLTTLSVACEHEANPSIYIKCDWKSGTTDNKAGDDGVRALSKALQSNSTLQKLDLQGEYQAKLNSGS